MKIATASADSQVAKPPGSWKAVLLHGANSGLVRERADACARAIVPDLKDAFRISDLPADELKRDPARLADEVAAVSMFGGRRVVRVRDATEGLAGLLERVVTDVPGDTLIVVEAGELTAKSNLRKLFEGSKVAAAIECPEDAPVNSAQIISSTLAGQGWRVHPDALAYLVDSIGSDRRLLRSELDKLLAYLGPGTDDSMLSREEAAALVGDSGTIENEDIANAVADGDLARLNGLMMRSGDMGISWGVAVGFALRQLQWIAAGIEGAGGLWGNMQKQSVRWDRQRLMRAMAILGEAEARTRTTGQPESAVAQAALIDAARLAKDPRRV